MMTREPGNGTEGSVPHRLGERALGGILWASSGATARSLVQLLVLIVLARLLAPSDFGVAAAALMVVRLSTVICGLGIGHAVVQRPSLDDDDISTAFSFSLLSGAMVAALIWGSAPTLAAAFRMPVLAEVLPVLAPAMLILGIGQIAEVLLSRHLRFRQVTIITGTAQIFGYGAVSIILAMLGFGVWSLVIAFLTQTGLKSLLCLVVQPHVKRLRIHPARLRALVRFGGGMVSWRLAIKAATELETFVIGRWLGAEALGLYNRARYLATTPSTFLGIAVVNVLFPVLAKIQGQRTRLTNACRRGITLVALLTVPASVLMAITAPQLIDLALGSKWQAAAIPLAILALSLPFRIGAEVAGSIAAASDAPYATAWRQAVSAGGVLIGAVIGQHWGISGVACGVLLALTFNYILMLQLLLGLTSLRPLDLARAHLPGLAMGVLVAAPVWLVHWGLGALGQGSLVVLPACLVVGSLAFLSSLHAAPRFVLGNDGLWALEASLAKVPQRYRNPLRQLLGRPSETPGAARPSAAI